MNPTQIVGNEKRGIAESKLNGTDPSNGTPLWDVPVATPVDLDDAVSAAKAAFTAWSALPHDERSKLVKEFASVLEQHKDEFTELLHRETGKPVSRMAPSVMHVDQGVQIVLKASWQTAFAESEVMMGVNTVRGNCTSFSRKSAHVVHRC